MKLTLIITDQTIKIFQPFSNLKIKNQASVKHFFFQKEKERQRKEKEKARKLSRQKIVFSNLFLRENNVRCVLLKRLEQLYLKKNIGLWLFNLIL